nr:calcium-binding protein [Oceanibaculum pacificum]
MAGIDIIYGGLAVSSFNPLELNDSLFGGAGSDLMQGNEGRDLLHGETDHDLLRGGKGQDTMHGDEGNDVGYGGRDEDMMFGGVGNDFLHGNQDNDTIDGGIGDDLLRGGQGDDSLIGGEGADALYGGRGNDQLSGGNGNDILNAGAGDDLMNGGAGDDVLLTGKGNDTVTGGTGADIFAIGPAGEGTGAGQNTIITDFTLGEDHLLILNGEEKADNAALARALDRSYASGNDLVLVLDDGRLVTLQGLGNTPVTAGQLSNNPPTIDFTNHQENELFDFLNTPMEDLVGALDGLGDVAGKLINSINVNDGTAAGLIDSALGSTGLLNNLLSNGYTTAEQLVSDLQDLLQGTPLGGLVADADLMELVTDTTGALVPVTGQNGLLDTLLGDNGLVSGLITGTGIVGGLVGPSGLLHTGNPDAFVQSLVGNDGLLTEALNSASLIGAADDMLDYSQLLGQSGTLNSLLTGGGDVTGGGLGVTGSQGVIADIVGNDPVGALIDGLIGDENAVTQLTGGNPGVLGDWLAEDSQPSLVGLIGGMIEVEVEVGVGVSVGGGVSLGGWSLFG